MPNVKANVSPCLHGVELMAVAILLFLLQLAVNIKEPPKKCFLMFVFPKSMTWYIWTCNCAMFVTRKAKCLCSS